MLRFPPLLLASAIAAASPYAFASDNRQADSQDPLEVLVTGTRSAQPAGTAPGQIDVITRDQIDASGATSVVEALRASGAVQITQNTTGNSNDGVVSMRGFGENAAQNVLILIDGRPLNNPTLQAPSLSTVSLDDVDRIEILHGSAGVLYGQRAVGGVINIITRDIDGRHARLNAAYGSDNRVRLNGHFSRRYASGVGVALSANRDHNDGYRDNSRTAYDQLKARLSYRYDGGEVGYSHQSVNNNQRQPGSLSDAEVAANRRATHTPNDFFDQDIAIDTLSLQQTLTSALDFDAEWSTRDTNGNGYFYGYYPQDLRVQSLTPRLQGHWSLPSGQLLLTAGADLVDSDFQTQNSLSTTNSEQNSRAAYLRAILPLATDWSLTLGGRHAEVKDKDLRNATASTRSAFVKELGLGWQFKPTQRLFLRRDENLRFATIDENAYTLPGIDTLKPQTGVSWEAGWAWSEPGQRLALTLYQLDLDNEILYDAAQYANVNLDSSRRRGLILSTEGQLSPALHVGGTYTFTDSELTSGSFSGNQVPYVARHQFSLYGNYRVDDAWSVYTDLQYIGHRYRAGDDANSQGQLNPDLILNLALKWQHGPWNARLNLNNLLNEKYFAYAGYSSFGGNYYYPAPERNLMLSVGYTF